MRRDIVHRMDAPADVVGRVGTVLRAVAANEPTGVTTTQLARSTGLARPTAHRLLTSLLGDGLLDRNEDGRWFLGPELYLLGMTAAPRYDVTTVAQPFVRRLASTTGESAFFSARRGDETVCLVREDGSFPIRSDVLHEGIRFPLGVASAGIAILAYLPDSEIEDYLSRTNLSSYGSGHEPDQVRARVRETRDAGFALNPGLIVQGSWGLGAAVFDVANRPQWALTLTGIEHRFAPARRGKLGRLLLRAAHELTIALRTDR